MKDKKGGVACLSGAREWLCLCRHIVGIQRVYRMNIAEARASAGE